MRILIGLVLAAMVMACSAERARAADAAAAIPPPSLYERLLPVFDDAAAGLYVIQGSAATGIGPGLEWRMLRGCDWLRFNLIFAASTAGSERLIPGLGVLVHGGDGTPDITLGICWTPDEYGAARVGPLKANAAPYVGLRVRM